MKKLSSFLFSAVIVVIVCMQGCENDSGSSFGDGHDYGDNYPDVYVALGDSIARGEGASVPYPAVLSSMLGKRVVNRGVDGARSSAGLSSINSALDRDKPGVLLILFGANDVIHGQDPASTVANLRGMIQAAKAHKTIPVIATLTPQIKEHAVFAGGVISLNVWIRSLASEEGVKLVDLESAFAGHDEYLTSDGLHPNNTGHAVIAAELFDVVK